jgi:hypothetical protein
VRSPFIDLTENVLGQIETLLSLYGLSAMRADARQSPEPARWIVASIGFSGEAARGALTLVGGRPFWLGYAARASVTKAPSEALLSDMAGELANMALGRLRNDLLRKGVELHPATPTCAFGDAIVLRDPGYASVYWQRLIVPTAGELFIRLDARLTDRFVLEENSAESVEPCSDALLFF